MTDLLQLATEVEALTGPQYEIERRVAEALGLPGCPALTASVDTGLALLAEKLPGWWVASSGQMSDGSGGWHVAITNTPWTGGWERGYGATFALALITAILRAVHAAGDRRC